MKLASRQSFLIDPDGQIVKHYEKVDPESNSTQMLADIESFRK
jgi:peroxiredoxin Q/BCP